MLLAVRLTVRARYGCRRAFARPLWASPASHFSTSGGGGGAGGGRGYSSGMVCRAAAAIASFAVVTAKSTTSSNPVETEEGSVLKNGANGDLGPALTRYSISSAAEQCAPCVVNIKCGVGGAWGPYAGGGISGISGGSGFILTEDGLVVTNAHVIANCTQGLTVTLPTGEKLSAKVKAMDHQTDLALLQVKADRPLPPAQIGNSGTLKAGEWVIALGSPLFLANSVTAGILSSVARPGSELGLRSTTEYLQTDASINTGNSGGPLVDLDGRVVGICTFKAMNSDGVSFAIPIDVAMEVINQLRTKGKVVRPYIGLKMVTVDRTVYEEGGQGSPHGRRQRSPIPSEEDLGVMVVGVVPGSPAERGGLRAGDIIIKFDGREAHTTRDVLGMLGLESGKEIAMMIKRPGTKQPMKVSIITEPEKTAEPRGHMLSPFR